MSSLCMNNVAVCEYPRSSHCLHLLFIEVVGSKEERVEELSRSGLCKQNPGTSNGQECKRHRRSIQCALPMISHVKPMQIPVGWSNRLTTGKQIVMDGRKSGRKYKKKEPLLKKSTFLGAIQNYIITQLNFPNSPKE